MVIAVDGPEEGSYCDDTLCDSQLGSNAPIDDDFESVVLP